MNSFYAYLFQTLLAAGLLTTASPWSAAAPSPQDPPLVRAELVSSVTAVRPGEQITVGLHQRIAPHWHTYWINPGDSGLPTTLEWHLPAGAVAGEIQWPAPHRFTQGPVTNHGYEDEVTLLSSIQVPSDAKPGTPLAIQAKAKWLVCREVCIPQEADLVLSLPVVAAGAARGEVNPLIEQARRQLPVQPNWTAQAVLQAGGGLALRIPKVSANWKAASDVWFYPDEWGLIAHNAPQPRQDDAAPTTSIQLTPGDSPATAGQVLKGVLVVAEGEGKAAVRRSYGISVTVSPGAAGAPAQASAMPSQAPASSSAPPDLSLGSALVLALLGGLVLNLMPCVFPVLSIKALALLSHSEQTPREARLHGLVYTAGVLSSFALLGGLLIALKAGGSQVGWGFQFQSPVFVLAVAYLMFAVGLSLSGVFTIGGSVTGVGSSLASRGGYAGSFFTGVLATVVATPCTAPFMGGAIGFALGQPALVLMAVFLSLGLGLALPYLLLSWWPRLQRWLPRPGLWMERVKQVLAFPMYGAAVWLVWVLAQQAGIDAVAVALSGLLVLAFAAWIYDSSRASPAVFRHAGTAAAVLFLAVAVGGGYVGIQSSGALASSAEVNAASPGPGKAAWEPYSAGRLSDLRAKGQPVFVNLTAAWCITCLVNERVALSRPSVADAFKASGITYLKGDWTNQDPEISRVLSEFGRSGVPFYLLYPEGLHSKPVVLPQILTPEVVLAAVKDAAAAALVSSR
ncbi:MAG: thiol:disulfide interchange protein [Rubrivivax sp.]|nr:MAG: thiol:disulfide interchange protein [Rubrivivax sp.]